LARADPNLDSGGHADFLVRRLSMRMSRDRGTAHAGWFRDLFFAILFY
jgi:hypothetical protein